MDIVEQSDNELLYMVRCGSKEAFDLLQYKYQKVIKKFITEYFNDFYIYGLDIEDIIQECLITFYESLFCFNEDKGMFYSYVMKSVKYRVYDLIKVSLSVKNNGFNYATTELEFENDNSYHNVERYGVDFEETNPNNYFVLRETLSSIFGENSNLSKEEKLIISLKVMGYTIEEIAAKTNLGRKRVEYIIKLAKVKIKEVV